KLRRKKSNLWATTSSSPTPRASPVASAKASPTLFSSSSIRLAQSPKPSTPSSSLAKPATTPSFLTAPVKPKTLSSPTLPSLRPPARSRPALPAAPTASPNTTSSFASKRNSARPRASTAKPPYRSRGLHSQGGHQVAQKFTSTTCPLYASNLDQFSP